MAKKSMIAREVKRKKLVKKYAAKRKSLLDGGQLVFTLIEGLRGKPVPVKVQMVVTQSSFFLLVGLSVLLIIRDTSQLLIVQRLLNQ